MKTKIHVTNPDLFNKVVNDVKTDDLSGLRNDECEGDIIINLHKGGDMVFSGQHYYTDFEDQFGFILVDAQ